MRLRSLASAAAGLILGLGAQAKAVEIAISCSALGQEYEICKQGVDAWAKKTGNTAKIVSTPNSATGKARALPATACRGCRRHRRIPDRRRMAGHPRPPPPRPEAESAGAARPAFQDHGREQHGRRQARRDALVRRCGAALLPQGPAREIQAPRAADLGGSHRDGADDPGRRAQGGPDTSSGALSGRGAPTRA